MKKNKLQLIALGLQQKIIFLGICYLLFASLLSSGCAKREIKNIDSKGRNIICFGDSITFGYGAETSGDYPSALARMTGITVINSGIDGDTSIEALKRVKTDILDRDPLLVIVEFGGNDFLRKIPREVTLNNMREIIDQIQAHGAMVAVADISTGMILREYRSPFLNLARGKGAIFIPNILSGIITNPRLKSDFIHPNSDGYGVIAQRIYRAIIPYLNQNSLLRQSRK
jgi:acyl-CoA thioesterase-1